MKWTILDPDLVDSSKFGLSKIFSVKVAKWTGKSDIRLFQLSGWINYAELSDIDQITKEQLTTSRWFIYAAKGIK
jgi:hypothetical protein